MNIDYYETLMLRIEDTTAAEDLAGFALFACERLGEHTSIAFAYKPGADIPFGIAAYQMPDPNGNDLP